LKKSFAELSSYELKVSLQVTKYLALLMLQQAGGTKVHRVPGKGRAKHFPPIVVYCKSVM
jgi:hypothetical protein